jgi:calcineurin-like phosphoesterase family protein
LKLKGLLAPLAVVVAIVWTAGAGPAQSVASAPVIAAAGDIACDPDDLSFNAGFGTPDACRQRYTSDLLVDRGLAGVLALGDIQYENGQVAKYPLSYDLSWGRLKSITHPAVGNHEYQTFAAAGYFDYFNGLGVQIGAAGDRYGKGYYSFDIGDWHLVALNSNCNDVLGGCGEGSPQERWLRQDLADHPTTCTLAFWHHPLFSSGPHGRGIDSTRPLFRALYYHGADLVLTGHDHDYERFAPQNPDGGLDRSRGIREFIVGTGGRNLYQQAAPIANSEVRNDASFGVLELTLKPKSYDWRFVPAAGSSFTDAGSEPCEPATAYARPRSAGKMLVRLVPDFEACTATNAVHGPPLAARSCSPPSNAPSSSLTVGTPDANGMPADFSGQLRLTVVGESPIDYSNGDQADVKISAGLTNVRTAGSYTYYAGELEGRLLLRVTDRANGFALDQPATVTDVPFSFGIPCLVAIGSACNLASTVDSILPGMAREGRRSVWQVLGLQIYDGGPDGSAATPDNAEFARPGLFLP